jgi:hypothetical protein
MTSKTRKQEETPMDAKTKKIAEKIASKVITPIDIKTFKGGIPSGADLVVYEKGDESNYNETALVLLGFDEIGMFDSDFRVPVYGFMGGDA